MARDTDPESRPISVAELLARRAAEAESADAPAAEEDRPTGRRRRAGEGGVSVAELTGEIPRIRGGAHSGSFPAIDRNQVTDAAGRRRRTDTSEDPAAQTIGEELGSTTVGEDFGSTRVGEELAEAAPTTGDLAAESSFVPDDPHVADPPRESTFPRSDRPAASGHDDHFPRSGPPVWDRAQAWSSPTQSRPEPLSARSRPDQPPATRDLNSADVQARFAHPAAPEPERADEVTGIIPRFGAEGADVADEFAGMSSEERDRAFESYRNFDDVAVEEEAPRKRRGLLGALRRRRSGDAASDVTAADDHASIAHIDLPASAPDDGVLDVRDDGRLDVADDGRLDVADDGRLDVADDGRLDVADDTPTELTDVSEPEWGARAWSDRPDVDDEPSEVAEPDAAREVPWTTRFTADRDDRADDVVDLDKAQRHDTVRPAWRGSDNADGPAGTGGAVETPGAVESPEAAGPSPARQWAMLGLQVIAGLVVGVGLFLGFTELWRWNVYFALVLAVVVIFGLVTFVHVVRRSSDLVSTLIALAVGLVVTIGPLALLASGS